MNEFIAELQNLTATSKERILQEEKDAAEKDKQKRLETENKARQKANFVIEQLPRLSRKEALAGRDSANIMRLRYDDFHAAQGFGYTCEPNRLLGAGAIVWEYCVDNGLKPTLDHWHDGMGINGGYEIVIHW